MSSPEQQEVELETVEINGYLNMGEALARLEKNPDFKTVIMEGYLGQNVKDSVSLLAVPAVIKQGERSGIMEDLVAASNLQYYFQMVKNFHEGALSDTLAEMEATEETIQ